MHQRLVVVALVLLLAPSAFAIQSGTDVIMPAASRGPGIAPSQWVTSLYVLNPGAVAVEVSFAWLVRDAANPNPLTVTRSIPAGAWLVLDDALVDLYGVAAGNGAFRITAATPVVVNAAIFNRAEGKEFGQGFEGIPTASATAAGVTTHAVGISSSAAYRTNFYAVDASGVGSTVLVEVLDHEGSVKGQQAYTLGVYEPKLVNVNTLTTAAITGGAVRFTVSTGSALVGCSRVNAGTGDPLTLNAWAAPAGSPSGGGLAPASLAGLTFAAVVTPIECDMAPFTESVTVQMLNANEARLTVYGHPMTIPLTSYTAAGDLGYVETSLPEWDITDTWVTMIWTSAAGGRFTGAATDYDGSPIQFSGTFTVAP